MDQIAKFKKEGRTLVLASLGAVASGKTMCKLINCDVSTPQRQVYSAIGQVKVDEY